MTIGNELDQAFSELNNKYEFVRSELNKITDRGFDITDVESKLDDLESAIEDVRDNVSYNDDRICELEAYKCSEDEVEYILDRKMDDRFDEAFDYALENIDFASLLLRVAELEARLNKPSLSGRILRWLREGPSIKETATSWYAGIRRGS